jgi:hypothetical protein
LNNTEILDSISPTKGQVLLFPHRLLHDSEIYIGNKNKTIIRTDIVFERVF